MKALQFKIAVFCS